MTTAFNDGAGHTAVVAGVRERQAGRWREGRGVVKRSTQLADTDAGDRGRWSALQLPQWLQRLARNRQVGGQGV